MAENKNLGILTLSGVRMIIKNFSGKKTDFNAEGDRNFGVVIDPETAEQLERDGIKVKTLRPRPDDPDGVESKWIKVKVNYNFRQEPNIYLVKADPDDPENRSKMIRIRLTEDTINQLDWLPASQILKVEMNVRFSRYPERPGRSGGVSNYLDTMYVTVMDDPLERKYGDIREIGREVPDYPVDEEIPW